MSVSKTVDKINGITRSHNWFKTHMYTGTHMPRYVCDGNLK